MSKDDPVEIWLKGSNKFSIYWGYAGTGITILEQPQYRGTRKHLWCMTDHLHDCKHVRAVKTYLQGEPPVLGE